MEYHIFCWYLQVTPSSGDSRMNTHRQPAKTGQLQSNKGSVKFSHFDSLKGVKCKTLKDLETEESKSNYGLSDSDGKSK